MATESTRVYTYQDLLALPEDIPRAEVLGGELIVSSAPSPRHQMVAARLWRRLDDAAEREGGQALIGPVDVYFSETDVIEPDVLYLRAMSRGRIEERRILGPPDVVVEVSSPSTRQIEIARKRSLYEANGVPEYWWVDLEADRVEVYRFGDQGYGLPALYGRGDVLESPLLPGLSIEVNAILGPSQQ
jgi:Uma2 family endonuclease